MYEKISYNGWPNCIRLFNDEIELIATTDIGPRIVRLGFIGKQNLFYLVPEHAGKTGGLDWRIYGGHRLWLAHLNQRGITDNLMINFMGFAPSWMGIKVINPEHEDEYVEMIISFFHYAIKTKNLKIGLIAPTNESEHHKYSEGPHLDARQHARIIRKLIDRMEALGILENIRIVAPDNASTGAAIKEFIPALITDPVVMSRIAHFGVHSYGGYYKGLNEFFQNSPFPKATYWVTEWPARIISDFTRVKFS